MSKDITTLDLVKVLSPSQKKQLADTLFDKMLLAINKLSKGDIMRII